MDDNLKVKSRLDIIKIGGNIIDDPPSLDKFLQVFAKIEGPKLLVHGGGKSASKLAEKMGVEVKMVDGRRITDKETLDIITMVYAGKINKTIVAKLQANDCKAIGFTGADANAILSEQRPVKEINYGFVGDIKEINTVVLELLIKNEITPVFCALTHDNQGQLLNTNADTIASELAVALSKSFIVELKYCFEKAGVLQNVKEDSSVLENLSYIQYKQLRGNGGIIEGMIPKLENCFHAIENGVSKVLIGNIEMLTDNNSKYTRLIA